MSAAPDRERLLAYLEDELGPEERAEIESLVASSPDWAAALAEERRLDAALAALPPVELPPQLEARFWARIAREDEGDSPGPLRAALRWWLGAGGLLAAAAAVLVFLRVTRSEPEWTPTDWAIATEVESLELLEEDVELLALVDILEEWDGTAS